MRIVITVLAGLVLSSSGVAAVQVSKTLTGETMTATATVEAIEQSRREVTLKKEDGTYVVEFRTADGEALAISIPRSETAVIRHFQERMPYGLFVPEVPSE